MGGDADPLARAQPAGVPLAPVGAAACGRAGNGHERRSARRLFPSREGRQGLVEHAEAPVDRRLVVRQRHEVISGPLEEEPAPRGRTARTAASAPRRGARASTSPATPRTPGDDARGAGRRACGGPRAAGRPPGRGAPEPSRSTTTRSVASDAASATHSVASVDEIQVRLDARHRRLAAAHRREREAVGHRLGHHDEIGIAARSARWRRPPRAGRRS